MEPFIISSSLSGIIESYPKKDQILEMFYENNEGDLMLFASQWLSEGIPFAFQNCPAIYEAMRSWLSRKFTVRAKEINLRGSARLGWSLAPDKFGTSFNSKSDLDIFVVSFNLFNIMSNDFKSWNLDYSNKKVWPGSDYEKDCWESNSIECSKNIQRGFMDSWKVPNIDKYENFCQINNILSVLQKKLSITKHAPSPSRVTVRCFKSWSSWEIKVSKELKYLAKENTGGSV